MADWLNKAAEAMDERRVKDERGSSQWKPEPGDNIIGILREAKIVPDRGYGPSLLVVIEDQVKKDEDGEPQMWEVYAGTTVLKGELFEQAPPLDKGIMIAYEGKVTPESGGRAYKKHLVVVESDEDTGVAFANRDMWAELYQQLMALEAAPKEKPVKDWGPNEAPF